MRDQVGIYRARAMIIVDGESIMTDIIKYQVDDDGYIDDPDDGVDDGIALGKLEELLKKIEEIETSTNERLELFDSQLSLLNTRQDLFDERLTSVEVNKIMITADVSRAKRKTKVDTLAATLILQSYLDSKK